MNEPGGAPSSVAVSNSSMLSHPDLTAAMFELCGLGGANHPLAMRARMLVVSLLPMRGWLDAVEDVLHEREEKHHELCIRHVNTHRRNC